MCNSINTACIQIDCLSIDVKANLKKAVFFIKKAAEKNANLVVLPELFNVGYRLDLLKNFNYDWGETVSVLSNAAKHLNIFIVAGVLENCGEKFYNSVIVFDNNGKTTALYRKINLFSPGSEKEIFEPGCKTSEFYIGKFKFGVMICYDIRFPELGRIYLEDDCTGLVVCSAFPFPRLEHWNTLLKARAIENQLYVIAANRTGYDGKLRYLGNSCIIDPWGNILAKQDDEHECVMAHNISLQEIEKVRAFIPCVNDRLWLDSVLKKR